VVAQLVARDVRPFLEACITGASIRQRQRKLQALIRLYATNWGERARIVVAG
jgi:hypothetical protein